MIYISVFDEGVSLRFDSDANPISHDWYGSGIVDTKILKKLKVKFTDKLKGTNKEKFTLAGLNEEAMKRHIKLADPWSDEDSEELGTSLKMESIFKGTAFGRDYSAFSAYAMLLKVGLPSGTKIHNHVIAKWTPSALKRYIRKIKHHIG